MIPRAMVDEFKDELFVLANNYLDAMADRLYVELLNECDAAVIEAKIDAEIKSVIEEIYQLKAEYNRRCFAAAQDIVEPTIN